MLLARSIPTTVAHCVLKLAAQASVGQGTKNFKFGLMNRGGHFPAGRRRFEDYDAHLRVWDLYQKRKSVSEIAKILSEKGPGDYSLQSVRDHLTVESRLDNRTTNRRT
jgi:hypothetical protein